MTLVPRPQHIAKTLGPALLLDADRVMENRQRGNLLTLNQATAEVDTSDVGPELGASYVRSTAAALQGVASFLVTIPANAVNAGINTASTPVAVAPGATYTAVASFRMSTATSRNCQVKFRWVDANNQQLGGTNFGSSVAATTGGWVQSTVSAVAPVGATTAYVVAVLADPTSLAGDAIYVDQMGFFEGTNTTWYHQALDASQAAQGKVLLTDSVQRVTNMLSAADASFESGVGSWSGVGGTGCATTTTQALVGTTSLAGTSNGSGGFTVQSGFQTVGVVAGATYWAVASVRAALNSRQVRLNINFYDSSGLFLASGVGAWVNDVTTGWTLIAATGAAPAGAARIRLSVDIAAAPTEVHYVDAVGLYAGAVSEFFHQDLGPGRADTGQAWTNLVGTWGVTNGALIGISASPATMYTDLGATQGVIEADITLGTGAFPGFVTRSDSAGSNNLVVLYNQGSNLIEVRRYVAAVPTVVASVALPAGSSTTGTVRHLKVAISQAGTLTATDTTSNTSVSYTILASDPASTYWGLRDAWPGGSPSSFKNVVMRDIAANDGDADSAVPDGSGKSAHATQPTSSSRPLWRSGFWRNLLTYGVATGADASTLTPTNAQVDVTTAQQAWGPSSFAVQPLNNVPNPSFETDASGWSSADQRAPVKRAIPYAYDDFTAADGTALFGRATPVGGKVWQIIAGSGWSITGNQATGAANGNGNWVDIGATDCDVTALVGTLPASSTNEVGIIARGTDVSNFYQAAYAGDGRVQLWKNVAGSFTALTALSTPSNGAVTVGRRFGLRCQGTRLAILVDGVEVVVVTDSSLTTGTKVGIRNAAPDTISFDNFAATVPYGPVTAQIGTAELSASAGAYVRQSSMQPSTQYSFSAYVNPGITGPVGVYGVQSPVPSVENGPLRRYQMVSKGPGALVEESTVNLVPFSGFEQGVTGWSLTGSATWFSIDPSSAFQGTQSMKVTSQGAGFCGFQASKNISVIGGQTYTVSAYVRKTGASNPSFYCITFDASGTGTSFGGTTAISATSTWTRYTLTATAPASAIQMQVAFVYPNNSTAGDTFWVDCVQLEQKGYATSYVDGALGSGYSYDATTNLLANPSLDVNATGWASGDSSSSLVRTTSQAARTGGAAAQISGASAFYRQAVSANTAYVLSGYVRLPSAGSAGLYLTGSPTASEVGPARRYQLAKNGPGILVEEATTNYCLNPSFEYSIAGYIPNQSNDTLTRDTTHAFTGSASLKVVNSTGQAQGGFEYGTTLGLELPVIAGQVYTFSAWVYATTAYTLQWATGLGTGGNTALVPNQWTRVVFTVTAAITAPTFARLVFPAAFGSATTLWVDAVQIEQKSYATTYVDGSLGTGYSWDGTTNLFPAADNESATNWNAGGQANSTLSADTARHINGSSGIKAVSNASGDFAANYGPGITVASGQSYTASAYIYIGTAITGSGVRLTAFNSSGTPLAASANSAFAAIAGATAGWIRVFVTFATVAAGSVSLGFTWVGNTAIGAAFTVDAVQLEQRGYATPYTTSANLLAAQDANFESVNNLGGWTSYGAAGATAVRSQAAALVGSSSMLVTLNATAVARAAGVQDSASFVAGQTYTASAWMMSNSALDVQVVINGVGNSATTTLSPGIWTRVSATWTESVTGSRAIALANAGTITGGQQFFADAIQVELGGLSNYAGAGTPGTTSSRAAGANNFNLATTIPLGASSAAAMFRVTTAGLTGYGGQIVDVGYVGTIESLRIRFTGNGITFEVFGSGSGQAVVTTSFTANVGDTIAAVATYDGTTLRGYYSLNGAAVVAVSIATAKTFTNAANNVSIGRNPFNTTNQANIPIENVLALSRVLSATEAGNYCTSAALPSVLANDANCIFSAFVNDTSMMTSVQAATWVRLLQGRTTVKGETQSDIVMLMPGGADTYLPEYVDDFQLEQRTYATPYTTNQNLLPANDSSFETSVGNWTSVGSGVGALTRDAAVGLTGAASLKKVCTVNFDGAQVASYGTPASASTYTASAWVLTDTTGAQVQVVNGAGAGSGATTLTAGVWTRISFTFTSSGVAGTDGVLRVRHMNAGTVPSSIWIDAVQVEVGGLSNYAGAGTPGTTSTRPPGLITYPVTSTSGASTLVGSMRLTTPATGTSRFFVRAVAFSDNSDTNYLSITHWNDGHLTLETQGHGGWVPTGSAAAAGSLVNFAITVDASGNIAYYVSIAGGAVQSATFTGGVALGAKTKMWIGPTNEAHENVMAFSAALDATTCTNFVNGTAVPSTLAARADCVFSTFVNDGPAASTNLTAGAWTRVSQTRTTTPRETQTDVVVIPATPQGQDSPVFIDAVQVQKGALSAYVDASTAFAFVQMPGSYAVTGNAAYTFRFSGRAASTTRTPTIRFTWLDGGGQFISNSNPTVAADSSTGWTDYSSTSQAPSNAASVQLSVYWQTGLVGGEVHYLDKIGFFQGNPPQWVPPVSLPNGQPVWQFDGLDDYVFVPDATAHKWLDPVDPATGITFAMVVAFRNGPLAATSGANYGYNTVFGHFSTNNGGPAVLGVYADRIRFQLGGTSSIDGNILSSNFGIANVFDSTFRVLTFRGTATALDTRVNGTQVRVTGTWVNPTVPDSLVPFSVGRRGSGPGAVGMDLGFFGVVQRALTDAELQRLERDLGKRFGVTVA